ncbi:MAG: hypothetical protein WAN11_17650, partial [Syntrophobacteraceae bacterium]
GKRRKARGDFDRINRRKREARSEEREGGGRKDLYRIESRKQGAGRAKALIVDRSRRDKLNP